MQPTYEALTPLDATFLELEQVDDGALMHIGAALVFDPPEDGGGTPPRAQLQDLIDQRLGLLPRFRCRLSQPRVRGLRRPAWIVDETFDLQSHVRHARLPEPGTEVQAHDWLSDFWSHRLDRGRPLWEMALVDGLEGGGWMLATKTHHAMVDGVGSMDVGQILLDAEPHPAHKHSYEPHDTNDGSPHPASRLPGWLSQAVATTQAAAGTVRHPRRLVRAGQAAAAMGEVLWQDELQAARHSTLNVPIGTTRRFTSVTLDLGQAKRIEQALGGTVNDVVLAVTTGALRRLLEQRGESLEEPLRAMVPVNLRGDDHTAAGNIVSSLFVELPIGEPDRRHRYDRTRSAAHDHAACAAGRRPRHRARNRLVRRPAHVRHQRRPGQHAGPARARGSAPRRICGSGIARSQLAHGTGLSPRSPGERRKSQSHQQLGQAFGDGMAELLLAHGGRPIEEFDSPDETRRPEKTRADVVRLASTTTARMIFEPGWEWSECIEPVAGTDTSQARHVGVAHSGRLHVTHQDGTDLEIGPGGAYTIEPGHDVWVVGDGRFVGFEFESQSAEQYARTLFDLAAAERSREGSQTRPPCYVALAPGLLRRHEEGKIDMA